MITEVKKCFFDCTQRQGVYAWDKVATLSSFSMCVILTFIDLFTTHKLNDVSFSAFVLMAGGSGLASIAKNKISAAVDGKANEGKI
jgi:hypothetical protein